MIELLSPERRGRPKQDKWNGLLNLPNVHARFTFISECRGFDNGNHGGEVELPALNIVKYHSLDWDTESNAW